MIHKKNILLFFLNICYATCLIGNQQKAIVIKSVADIRSIPVEPNPQMQAPTLYNNNPYQLSQALFGEFLLKEYEVDDNWSKVKTLEQMVCSQNGKSLEELNGFILSDRILEIKNFPQITIVTKSPWSTIYTNPHKDSNQIISVCIGTKLCAEKISDTWHKVTFAQEVASSFSLQSPCGYIESKDIFFIAEKENRTTDQIRMDLIKSAVTFLENPYCWGGRSYKNDSSNIITGSDCSGFTNLVYRINGLEIPKNSRSQFYASTQIDGNQVKHGDLIFFAKPNNPKKIIHVMLYLGDGNIIENTGKDPIYKTRITTDTERLKNKISNIKNGTKNGNYIIYFGTYLGTKEKIKEARERALQKS